nr:hypothetical protein [Klebsiella pneumoniae]
ATPKYYTWPSSLSLHDALPVTAVVLGWIFLGQKIQGMALVGLSVVLASVMSIQRALARQAAGAKTKKAP